MLENASRGRKVRTAPPRAANAADQHERAKHYPSPGETAKLPDAAKAGRHGVHDHLLRQLGPALLYRIIVTLLLALPSPLAAQGDPYSLLSSLVGHSEAELIRRFGQPADKITTIDGERLIYETLDAGRSGGRSGQNSRDGDRDDSGLSLRSYAFRCRTEVVIADGHVRAFNRSGNDCH